MAYVMIRKSEINPEPPAVEGLMSREDLLSTYVTGSTYYLDSENGNDSTGSGSNESPWQTLVKAQAEISEGDCIVLKGNGNYGAMTDAAYSGSRTNWNVWINAIGSTPVINNINMIGQDDYNLRQIFYGIKIAPAWVDPGESAPYTKTASCIYIWAQHYLRFYNCEIVGTNKYLTPDIAYLRESSNIYFERCHCHKAGEGIVHIFSDDITIYYSYIHEICACGIKDGWAGGSNILIEGNHIHDCEFSTSDEYGEDASFHGSIIAINNGTTTVRGNFLHDGGGTSGINFYEDGSPVYHDVLIENNVLYNTTNAVAMVVEQVATNIVIRNNTICGKKRDELGEDLMYNYALYLGTIASGFDGSGVSIYNNVFVGGATIVPSTANMHIDDNILYYTTGEDLDTAHSIIALEDETSAYFESGFFNGALLLEYLSVLDSVLDLTLETGSDGLAFGSVANQSSTSLGTFDVNEEFLNPDGTARDASHHDAGAYQS